MTGRNIGCSGGQGCGSGQGFKRNKRSSGYKQESDKKEMKFLPKIAGEVQGHTHETIEDYIMHKLWKDSEHGEDITKNLRKGVDTGVDMKEPIREETKKNPMTTEQRDDVTAREEFVEEQ